MNSMSALLVMLTVYALTGLCHSVAGEQLVLAEGEERSILCTAPAEVNYNVLWAVDGIPVNGEYMGFTVGEEEMLGDGMKGKRIMFTATTNVSLRCVITDVLSVDSFDPLVINIIVQGFNY